MVFGKHFSKVTEECFHSLSFTPYDIFMKFVKWIFVAMMSFNVYNNLLKDLEWTFLLILGFILKAISNVKAMWLCVLQIPVCKPSVGQRK